MPHSIDFLLSDKAAAGRLARGPGFVVHAEIKPGRYVELDADDMAHADRLAATWVRECGAVNAAIRRVYPAGTLGEAISGIGRK